MIKAPSSFKKEQLIFENWRSFLQSEEVEPTVWLQMVKENYEAILEEDPFNEDLMEEGVWSKIKYYVGKMGSMEKGGKMFGGRKKRVAAAEEKLSAAIEQAAKKGFGDFRTQLEADFPEFPNMEETTEFQSALYNIGEIYDSIDAAVAKYDAQGAEVKGGLDPSSANVFVSALRQYVEHLLDYKLSDSYKHFKENEEKDQDRIDEAPPPVGGVARVGAAPRRPKTGGPATAGWAPEDPNAPKDSKYTKRGADGDAVDSETIKGLESNILPLLLGLTGVAGIAIGVLLKTPWALETFKSIQGIKKSGSVSKTVMQTNKAFKAVQSTIAPQSGEGFTQMFGRIAGGNPATFGPDSPPTELFSAMSKLGIDPKNPKELFELGCDPAAYNAAVSGNAGSIGEMFPASNQDLWLDKGTEAIATAQEEVVTQIAKTTTKTVGGGAAAVAAGQLAAASTLATTLGIGLVASGVAVKLIRMKGLKSSRAQMLQDLSKELQPFPGGIIGPESPPVTKCDPPRALDKEGNCGCPETGDGEDQVWDKDALKCVPVEPPPPVPPKKSKRIGLVRFDDDGTKVYVGTRRSDTGRDHERQTMKRAQDQAITGRNTDPKTDDLNAKRSKGGFKMSQRAEEDPIDSSWEDVESAIQGRSPRDPEPYVTIDASIYNDAAAAVRKGGTKVTASNRQFKAAILAAATGMLNQFVKYHKKQTVPQASKRLRSAFKKSKIDLPDAGMEEIIKVFQIYGLVRPGKSSPAPKKVSKKGSKKKTTASSPTVPGAALQESITRNKKWKIRKDGSVVQTVNENKKWKILKDGSVIRVLNEKK